MKRTEKRQRVSMKERQKTIGAQLSFEASEAYKRLRTNIQYTLPLNDEKRCRVIGVTSALPGEGKSTTSVNLAFSLAEAGEQVLLIDADMRLPTLSYLLDIECIPGLSDYLVTADQTLSIVKPTKQHKNLHIIPAGNLPPNPAELLGLERMREMLNSLAKTYDYILIDLPPINVVTDAAVISKYVDGILMVVRQNYDKKHTLDEALRFLKYADARIIGFVLNCSGKGERSSGKYEYRKEYGG
ncbi:MAG: CpsD/CapB family tyrosine-protein kinase [Clostridia bacterium]|nr:CpsD/CapB family tyrosine-protein kinase [Clostridia bacterium]